MASVGDAITTAGDRVTPLSGRVVFNLLSMVNIFVLAVFLTQRIQSVQSWRCLPIARWLILIIYLDSVLFVVLTTLFFNGVGIDDPSLDMCNGAALLCGMLGPSNKVEEMLLLMKFLKAIYYFLLEKVYVVRMPTKSRMKSKLYLLNCFGVMVPYAVVLTLNFRFRFAHLDDDKQCFLGIKRFALIAVIVLEFVINAYLTTLFIVPLRRLYGYRSRISGPLRTVAIRSFVGSVATTAINLTNLIVLMALNGEKGWLCLLCCNVDILFTVFILHWVSWVDTESGADPTDVSFHFRSWRTGEGNNNPRRSAGASSIAEVAVESVPEQEDIGSDRLVEIRGKIVPMREVHFHDAG